MHELEAIDIGSYLRRKTRTKETALVKKIMHQMSTVGFLLLSNIPDYNQDELLRAITAFHTKISLDDKMKMAPKHFNSNNDNRLRGFFPFIPNDPSHKEFYDMSHSLNELEPEEL